jgi:hypothetical protein
MAEKGREVGDMAGFARGPDDITARLREVIEYLQSDAVLTQAELHATFLLRELTRLLTAAPAGMDRGILEWLIRQVRDGRADILNGDLALALKRFQAALEYWMKPAKKGE